MTWKAIARSAIGTSHQKQQMPCQDYSDYKIINQAIVGAVADGAGSAKYADIGAKLAVETVLTAFTEQDIFNITNLHKTATSVTVPLTRYRSERAVKQFFRKTVKKIVTTLKEQAASDGFSVEDFACTLLIVVATSNGLAAMQIGDGFIIVRHAEEEPKLLFTPDKGEYINETTFVTSANALEAMRVVVQTEPPKFICASTDGLERLAIRMSDHTPFIPFFKPLEEYLWSTKNPEQEEEYLVSFLNSDRLNVRSDDDKTLLLCLYDSSSNLC